ncbi:MAG: DUF937 domain-containing protein [Ruminococcaceae bacterium]|nr:DUF937 domain-containing protein [Oscillospiraceae bacterium]
MDISAVMTTLLSSDSVKSLSKKTGTSQKDVKKVLSTALPLLLQGADNQAKDKVTAESFTKALMQHSQDDTNDLNGFFDNVDMADGAKILGHLLGADTDTATQKVSEESGTKDDDTTKILVAAAPLLMSLLGQESKKSKKGSKKSNKNTTNELVGDLVTAVLDNVDVGSLLAGMLSTQVEEEETETKTTTKKKTTAKKSTTAKKTTAKKSTAKKSTAAKKTTTKKKAATKKKSASENEGVDIGDVATLLTKILT